MAKKRPQRKPTEKVWANSAHIILMWICVGLTIDARSVEPFIKVPDEFPVTKLELKAGDSLLLTGGGHGFDVLEECQLIEVKQGPYLGMDDKVKFG